MLSSRFRLRRALRSGSSSWLQPNILIAMLCLFSVHIFAAGSRITVRFIDPESGKPIRNMWITLTQYKGDPPATFIPSKYVLSNSRARTDSQGEVVAVLRKPEATYIAIHSFDLAYSGFLIPLADVLQTGVVVDCSSGRVLRGQWVDADGRVLMKSGATPDRKSTNSPAKITPAAHPGVVIFIERKLTIPNRIRQEIPR